MTSAEKIRELLAGATALKPDTAEEAQLYGVMRMVAPMAGRFIPEDPERLDEMLLQGARLCLGLRSDDAPSGLLEIVATESPEDVLEALGVAELAAADEEPT
jgi:hypothetical protein